MEQLLSAWYPASIQNCNLGTHLIHLMVNQSPFIFMLSRLRTQIAEKIASFQLISLVLF